MVPTSKDISLCDVAHLWLRIVVRSSLDRSLLLFDKEFAMMLDLVQLLTQLAETAEGTGHAIFAAAASYAKAMSHLITLNAVPD